MLLQIPICSEYFTDKSERANDIYDWFKSNPKHMYSDYKKEVNDSDIVEYSAAKKLHNKGMLNSDNIFNNL
jgi:hypothetical protein